MSAAELLAGNLAVTLGAGVAFTALHVALEVRGKERALLRFGWSVLTGTTEHDLRLSLHPVCSLIQYTRTENWWSHAEPPPGGPRAPRHN